MTKTIYTAAIDLGATSGRIILGAWAHHQLTLTEAHRFPNAYRELGTHTYWELGTFWTEVQTGLRKAAALLPRGAKLAAVGVDTWGCDHVLLNDAGRLVFPPHAYRDNRTQAGLKALACPGHDTACAYDAMPAAEDGNDLFLSSGTWSLVGFESATPCSAPRRKRPASRTSAPATAASARSPTSPGSSCSSRS
jgi:sugar (pentulose or hexulose) kinase